LVLRWLLSGASPFRPFRCPSQSMTVYAFLMLPQQPRLACKGNLQGNKKFYFRWPAGETDFSRFEALVRKRESLLKFIYERRKGEGCSALGRKRGPFSCPSLHFQAKKKKKNIRRANKNMTFDTAQASFGISFVLQAASYMPSKAQGKITRSGRR